MVTALSRYEELRASVAKELVVPERFNFVADTLERWRSDRLAILWLDDSGAERRFSWAQLCDDVSRVANVLRASGVRKGDRVFIQVGRAPEWWQTMLACLKIGAIAMPGTVMPTCPS
jgi:acyl-coenzyme A synthetase/AMP-(fatty) acid ligase